MKNLIHSASIGLFAFSIFASSATKAGEDCENFETREGQFKIHTRPQMLFRDRTASGLEFMIYHQTSKKYLYLSQDQFEGLMEIFEAAPYDFVCLIGENTKFSRPFTVERGGERLAHKVVTYF